MGAVIDSVGVNNAQTSATDANDLLPNLEQPLSPTGGATSTTIDTSQRVSSASSPHNVQMEIKDTPIYLDTREIYTTQGNIDISDGIESSPHTQLQTICKILLPSLVTVRYIFTKSFLPKKFDISDGIESSP